MSRLTQVTRSRVVLVLIASISCKSDSIVQPASHVIRDLADAVAEPPRIQRVQVKSLVDGRSITGSSAVLKREIAALIVRVETRDLSHNEAVDLFWAIFNNPVACTHPNALTGAPCSPPDLFVAATQASLHYAATLTADARGKLAYSATLAAGSTAGCLGAPFPCFTLTNPHDAEVHSALFVPNGGPGRQAAQFFRP